MQEGCKEVYYVYYYLLNDFIFGCLLYFLFFRGLECFKGKLSFSKYLFSILFFKKEIEIKRLYCLFEVIGVYKGVCIGIQFFDDKYRVFCFV